MEQQDVQLHPRQRAVYIMTFIIWFVYNLVQTSLIWWAGFSLEIAINDGILSATVLALSCLIISNALNYYIPSKRRYSYIVIWTLVLSTLAMIVIWYSLRYILTDVEYLTMIKKSFPIRFLFFTLLIGWVATINILYNIQLDFQENEKRKRDAEWFSREAELYNLRQQLQPHFLFNSLNSIIALIGNKPAEARNMTFQLSDFLRGTLRKDDQQLIPVQEEIEHVRLYLEIEKVRFGHRLDIQVDSPEEWDNFMLPPMITQPLVENAIKFGLYDTTGPVRVELKIMMMEGMLTITVSNPFDKQSRTPTKGTGFGLRGVQRRLFLLYGRTDLLETRQTDRIFTSILKIPQA